MAAQTTAVPVLDVSAQESEEEQLGRAVTAALGEAAVQESHQEGLGTLSLLVQRALLASRLSQQ